MDYKEQGKDSEGRSGLVAIRRGIENIQKSLNQLSPDQMMRELETIKIWVTNKENERNTD